MHEVVFLRQYEYWQLGSGSISFPKEVNGKMLIYFSDSKVGP